MCLNWINTNAKTLLLSNINANYFCLGEMFKLKIKRKILKTSYFMETQSTPILQFMTVARYQNSKISTTK